VARLTFRKPDSSVYRSWFFVIALGSVLAVLSLISRGDLESTPVPDADGSTGCVMVVQVTEDELNLREGPSLSSPRVGALPNGARVDATTTVESGYRQLEDGSWAAAEYLIPEAGSSC
jgi:uncharacterized protein YgiM (DUF1202 family)